MASRRVLASALRFLERAVAASSASNTRCFARQASNWTPHSTTHAGKTLALPSQRTSRLVGAAAAAASRRAFSSSPASRHGHIDKPKAGEELHVTFIDKDGQSYTFEVSEGDNLLDIAQANDLEMEGACGGSCACSTCHVIVEDEAKYEAMEEPDDDENDMLDLAFGLTETSRLGCQVKMTKELDGLVVKLPSMTRNLQASDFK